MAESYVIVHRSYDPIVAEHLGSMLRETGVAVRVLGTRSAALIGAGQSIMQMHIEVPISQAGSATDFLEAYFETDGEELLSQAGLDSSDSDLEEIEDSEGDKEIPLSGLFAAGSCVLFFGAGHIYGRRAFTAVAIAIGQIWGIRVFVTSTEWTGIATAIVILVTLLVCDVVGSQRAVREYNRGTRRSTAFQLAIGAAFVSLAVALGSILGPRIPEPPNTDSDPYIPAQY